MNVSLTPELEELVAGKVASGMYNSASEVVREALRCLKERDDLKEIRLRQLRRDVQAGFDQIDQREATEYTSGKALAEAVKAAGRDRMAGRREE